MCEVSPSEARARPIAPDNTAISTSGRVYWLDHDTLKIWEPRKHGWGVVRKWRPGEIVRGALAAGEDDLLLFEDHVTLARGGQSFSDRVHGYEIPFYDETVGIGFFWRKSPDSHEFEGTLRSLKDLHEICPITGTDSDK